MLTYRVYSHTRTASAHLSTLVGEFVLQSKATMRAVELNGADGGRYTVTKSTEAGELAIYDTDWRHGSGPAPAPRREVDVILGDDLNRTANVQRLVAQRDELAEVLRGFVERGEADCHLGGDYHDASDGRYSASACPYCAARAALAKVR